MAIQTKVRVFYELVTTRVLSTKAFKLAELLPDALIQTDAEILSKERLDPLTNGVAEVFANIVSEKQPRVLRIVPLTALQDIGAVVAKPTAPFSSRDMAGREAKIEEKGSVKNVIILDAVLDLDLHDTFVVEVADPTKPEENPPRQYSVIVIERTAVTLFQDVVMQKFAIDATGKLKPWAIIEVKDIAQVTNEGFALGIVPINNSVSVRRATNNIAGLIDMTEASSNTNSSRQEGRNGFVRWTRIPKVGGGNSFFLQWKPPEATNFGLPVLVTSPPDSTCDFTLKNVRDVEIPDTDGETLAKETKLMVTVNASLFPTDLTMLEEEIVVRTAFRKTFDGQPILGESSFTAFFEGGFFESPPARDIVRPFGADVKGSKTVGDNITIELNVDPQGLFHFYDPLIPIPEGREAPPAIFERRFSEVDEDVGLIVQKEGIDRNFDVWVTIVPTAELVAYVEEQGFLRPYTKDPQAPDFKTYPYGIATPVDLRNSPETLLTDEELLSFALAVAGGEPTPSGELIFDAIVSGIGTVTSIQNIPFVRSTEELYYFFVIEQDNAQEFTISPNKNVEALEQDESGNRTEEPAEVPLATFLTNTESGRISALTGKIAVPSLGEPVMLFVYPRAFSRDTGAVEGRIAELAQACGEDRSTLETEDALQEALILFSD